VNKLFKETGPFEYFTKLEKLYNPLVGFGINGVAKFENPDPTLKLPDPDESTYHGGIELKFVSGA
jgi:hypothetical protein